ncbi:hypothetical protein [Geodermatophilus sp. FMUSA9-8]|uniref:hypothetical protein n=1 Tax=Geodermatophilus sp. FMUSA9-8 TaxID=3120155 RepID=UPI003008E86F
MTDDDRVRASLAALADDLAGDPGAVTPERVRAAHRRGRQVRATVAAVALAVVVLVGGLPLLAGRLAAPDGEGAGPAGTSAPAMTPSGTPSPTVQSSVTPTSPPPGYADLLAVRDCLVGAGFAPDPPVTREEFLAGADWSPYDGLTEQDAADGAAACPVPG